MTSVRFAVTGRLGALSAADEARLLERGGVTDPQIAGAVERIVSDVRVRGDVALRELAARYDGVTLDSLEVPRAAWDAALASLPGPVYDALHDASIAIADFHRAQLPAPLEIEVRPGVRLGRRAEPLRRVGVYAPGGRAAYPSSVLMGVVPARIAGVTDVIVCSPPGADGIPPAAVLAACRLAGADRVFALGGAGAIAAMAHGTATVPRVDRVVGPGNVYVAEAKRQLTGVIGIDCPAGPSEVLIIADASADATTVAAELIAQAEHDPDAAAVLITTDPALIDRVTAETERLLQSQPRRAIATAALAANGGLLTTSSIDEAIDWAQRYAPEHLLLLVAEPRQWLERVRCAGTVFLGRDSSVTFGDYITGANHVLPTGGLARAYGGLSTLDFLRCYTWQEITMDAAHQLATPTATLADVEGLPGHAFAARLRLNTSAHPPSRSPAFRFRPAYRDIDLYEPGRVPTAIDLSDNTNLFGVSPAVQELFSHLPSAYVTRYPTVYAADLKRAFAAYLGVGPENVVTGCGSDDIIDSALRAFCEPGDPVAYPVPTFGVVRTFTRMNAARPVEVPLSSDFRLDAAALLATGARAFYLCRPNNPTGTVFDRAAVERVMAEARGIVLIDEAYADFAEDDLVQTALRSDRAVILRTMSKAFGLAGLRVGFAVGPAPLIAEIEKSRGPYKVGGAAEAAALAVLTRSGEWVRQGIATVRENRGRMANEMQSRGFRFWPSSANFLLIQVPPGFGGALALTDSLRQAGVQVRPFPGLPQAGDCIRVSLGPWSMMEAFLDALDSISSDARAVLNQG